MTADYKKDISDGDFNEFVCKESFCRTEEMSNCGNFQQLSGLDYFINVAVTRHKETSDIRSKDVHSFSESCSVAHILCGIARTNNFSNTQCQTFSARVAKELASGAAYLY